jgi:hypothetical protein
MALRLLLVVVVVLALVAAAAAGPLLERHAKVRVHTHARALPVSDWRVCSFFFCRRWRTLRRCARSGRR